MDLQGPIPTFIRITVGSVHDVNILDDITFEPGAICVTDRGYVDFARLHRIHNALAFFVTRAKRNLSHNVSLSRPVEKTTGLQSNKTIVNKVHGINKNLSRILQVLSPAWRDFSKGASNSDTYEN